MQKILFVSHSHRIDGGAELSLISTLLATKERGIQCHVILPKSGPFSKKLDEINIEYTIQNYTWSAKSPNDSPERDTVIMANYNAESIMTASDTIQSYKPDAVVVNTIMVPWYGYAARALQVPCILMARETLDGEVIDQLRPSCATYLQLLARTFDSILYNSHFLKRIYQQKEQLFQNLYSDVYKPAITLSTAQKKLLISTTSLTDTPIKLLSIGAISPHKNQRSVVEALGNLTEKERSNYHLTITGSVADETYKASIEQLIQEKNLTNCVTLHDYTTTPLEHIQEHDCLIMSSEAEAFGRVTIEGMLLGRFVIGRNTGATPDIIDNETTGLLYETDQHATLTEALRWLVSHKKKAATIAEKAQKSAVKTYIDADVFEPFFNTIKHTIDTKKKDPSCVSFYDPVYCLIERNVDMNRHIKKYATALKEASATISKHEDIRRAEVEIERKSSKRIIKKLLGRN